MLSNLALLLEILLESYDKATEAINQLRGFKNLYNLRWSNIWNHRLFLYPLQIQKLIRKYSYLPNFKLLDLILSISIFSQKHKIKIFVKNTSKTFLIPCQLILKTSKLCVLRHLQVFMNVAYSYQLETNVNDFLYITFQKFWLT